MGSRQARHAKFERIKFLLDGSHEHHLESIVRFHDGGDPITQLLRWVKKRTRHTIPTDQEPLVVHDEEDQEHSKASEHDIASHSADALSDESLEHKYGKCKEVIGWGSSSTVRLSYKKNPQTGRKGFLFAVKTFRQLKKDSPHARHARDVQIATEYHIASSLHHTNVITTLDLLNDAFGNTAQVMELCDAGDLHTLIIAAGKLEEEEADCLFKQLMRGLAYCHEQGVTHRDVKPENILLTTKGCLKISDFGCAGRVQRDPDGTNHDVNRERTIQGSRPYAAPELFAKREGNECLDGSKADVWASAVVYVAMRTGKLLWKQPTTQDVRFSKFIDDCASEDGYMPIEIIEGVYCRKVLYQTLHLDPNKRPKALQVLESRWCRGVKLCEAGGRGV